MLVYVCLHLCVHTHVCVCRFSRLMLTCMHISYIETCILLGQLMVKGMEIDPIKKILVYPDNRDPVPVETDNAMTGKTCWKAMNPGRQGEGLIKGSILDYMVSSLLEDDFVLKKTM